ncbi:ParB/RepB/Spo0J family partition protein [Elongatibacter sediminis]|uniref:Probable chromosome-partitioning protein ParB n=1 Tax=Elongatibacter sediminis TaxID=3119006 RepID=A0AAW9REU0_9GAMM
MTTRKKAALGRNLSSLLSQTTLNQVSERENKGKGGETTDELRNLSLDLIRPGRYQPRSVFDPDKLEELANSIRAQGVVQPVVVRRTGDDEYELIAGERRWRAAQIAGIEAIPAVVRDVPDEVTVAMALIENIQREDLNPLEEASALKRLIDEFEMTHREAAEAVGRSRASVSNLLRLLELMQEVKDMVDSRLIEMGHARALLSLDSGLQVKAAREVVQRKLSVRETEALVRRLQQASKAPAQKKPDPDILRLQNRLQEKLGSRVRVQHGQSGKGKLVIPYNNADELDGILGHLGLDD